MSQDYCRTQSAPDVFACCTPTRQRSLEQSTTNMSVRFRMDPFRQHAAPPTPPFSDEDDKENSLLSAACLIDSLGPLQRLPSLQCIEQSITPPQSARRATRVVVIGVGYVGKHLVERFGEEHEVIGVDLSEQRCAALRSEFAGKDNVTFVSDVQADKRIETFDLALISVPTMLCADNKTMDTRHICAAVLSISKYGRAGAAVVIESSVSVGMTRTLLGPQGANLRAKGVYVGFSPERVDPGRTLPAFKDIPKVVSGIDEESLNAVAALYAPAFTTVVPVPSLETAEFCKLYENCQRLMMIAYANEMADAAQQHGIDMHDVCAASATKPFGYAPFTPSLGAGGHCIPVNPWYLLSNCDAPLLRAAAQANQQRPTAKAREVIAALSSSKRSFSLSVLVIGMGFKRGEASMANSPSASMADKLCEMGCKVDYMDDSVAAPARWNGRRLAHSGFVDGGARLLDERYDAVVVAHKMSDDEYAILSKLRHAKLFIYMR